VRGELLGQLGVCGVAGFDGGDVTDEGFSEERNVADDVQDLVADELIRIAKRFVGENRIIADDDGILKTAAFDETVGVEIFDFFKETERACVGDFLGPGFRVNFDAEIFGHATAAARTCAGNLELVVRENRNRGIPRLHFEGFLNFEFLPSFGLRFESGLFDHPDIFAGTAISDRGLVGVQFHNGIVHLTPTERGQYVFDGMQSNVPFAQGCRAVRIDDVLKGSLDLGAAV